MSLFAFFAFLWRQGAHDLYVSLLGSLGIFTGWSGYQPFTDLHNPLQWLTCNRMGFDVFNKNPCSTTMNYSPIWLLLPPISTSPEIVNTIGILLGLLFLLTVFVFCRPKTLFDSMVYVLAICSPDTIVSIERCNIDIVLFTLVGFGGFSLIRKFKCGSISYSLIYLSALLKFYPLIALGTAIFSKPRVFLLVLMSASISTLLFLLLYHHFLALVLSNLPYSNPLLDIFSGKNIFSILKINFDRMFPQDTAIISLFINFFYILFVFLCATLSVSYANHLNSLDSHESQMSQNLFLFLASGFIFIGVFFSGQNAPYRAVWLIMLLPFLSELRIPRQKSEIGRLSVGLTLIIIGVMWVQCIRHIIALWTHDWLVADIFVVVLREGLWWTLAFGVATIIYMYSRSAPTLIWLKQMIKQQ